MINMNNSNPRILNLLSFLTCMFAFFVLFSSAFAQKRLTKEPRPAWADKVIPGYFVGISHKYVEEADARADALNDAKRQIIESLGVIIDSETKDSIVEMSGKTTSLDAFMISKVKVISKAIIAVSPEKVFVEQWQEGSGRKVQRTYQAFVLVPFSEDSYRSFMKDLTTETMNAGKKKLQESLDLARSGNVFLAIKQITSAVNDFAPMVSMTGITPAQLAEITSFRDHLKSRADAIISGIVLEGSGDNQLVKLGSALERPLQLSVFWKEGINRYPIPGLKVDFMLLCGKATFTPAAQTNDAGVALCTVRDIASAGKVEIAAKVHFPDDFGLKQDTYTFHLIPENRVVIRIIETNMGKPVGISYLENALLEKFTSVGFTVVENQIFQKMTASQLENSKPESISALVKDAGADLVVLGTIASGQANKVQEGFYFARARGSLKIFNISKQSIVGNYIIEDKNAGNSEENAGSKAITMVSDLLIQKMMSEIEL